MPELPLKSHYCWIPRPVFHPIHPNCSTLSTSTQDINGGIYQYHLENHEVTCLAKYNEIEQIGYEYLKLHGQFIDSKNDKLYICGGWSTAFLIYDVNTGRIKVDEDDDDHDGDLANCGYYVKTFHISSSTKNEIHILGWNKQRKFDCIQQKLACVKMFVHGIIQNCCTIQ